MMPRFGFSISASFLKTEEKGKVRIMAGIEWQKETKKLEDYLQDIKKRLEANFIEIKRLSKRQETAEEKLKNSAEEMEELRKSRQKKLVLGENIAELNERIRRLTDEREILSDEIQGIKDRIGVISQENSKMFDEEKRVKREILILKAPPLRQKYNELAEQMTTVVSDIWKLIGDLHEEIGSLNSRAFAASTWGGALALIPRLYDPSDFQRMTPLDIQASKQDFFVKK